MIGDAVKIKFGSIVFFLPNSAAQKSEENIRLLGGGEWGGGGAVPVGLYGMLFFPHRYTSKSTYCDNVITPIHMSFIKGGRGE